MSTLPSKAILEKAWDMIRHLATGPGPATPAVADECRKLVLAAQAEQTPKAIQPKFSE